MTGRSETVTLSIDYARLSANLEAWAEVGRNLGRRMELESATWEPHDWSEWA